jgi:thymidylate kinase
MDAAECARAAKVFNRPDRFLKWLAKREADYYRKIAVPDLLIVLKVNPEIAVQRKPAESEDFVRRRSSLVCSVDWKQTSAYVVDASLSKESVLTQVKAIIWDHL